MMVALPRVCNGGNGEKHGNRKRKKNKEEDEKEDGECSKATGLSVVVSLDRQSPSWQKEQPPLLSELVTDLQGALKVSSTFETNQKVS